MIQINRTVPAWMASQKNVITKFLQLALVMLLLAALSSCGAKQPKLISISGIPYNYTDQTVFRVSVNGQGIRVLMDGVKPGGVSGGGVVCCIQVPEGASEALVEVDLGSAKYTTHAKIEKWWPDLAHYAVVHVLPGKKVVMQITPSFPAPRKDLLEAQQKALGLPVQIKFQTWSAGPIERVDGKQ